MEKLMHCPPTECDVLIVGAGPVGMLLAILLHQNGHKVAVVDQRTSIYNHSRAIGIHPPGLNALETAGIAHAFVESGRFITGGWAYVNGTAKGQLRFDSNPGKWKRPLVVPQQVTEQILQDEATKMSLPIFWGWKFCALDQKSKYVSVSVHGPAEQEVNISCSLVVGCDGKRSTVRQSLGSFMMGGQYRDRYLMADFDDDGILGDQAIINMHRDGLVECFPLPNGKRRWVARLSDRESKEPDVELLVRIIKSRIEEPPELVNPIMFSSFGIERWRANRIVSGRVALAGDAAHVVSPIGGQGMNLGWMDAVDLANCVRACTSLEHAGQLNMQLSSYEQNVQRRAKRGIRRAWFNTMMGRPGIPAWVKAAAVRLIVNTGMQRVFARRFTMLDL